MMAEGYAADPLVEELFDDVRLMTARAREHEPEFYAECSRPEPFSWWNIDETRLGDDRYRYTLVIRCQQLKGLKPIAADLCNNLVHALDQIAGALARMNNRLNFNELSLPWQVRDSGFEQKLRVVESYIGTEPARCIRQARIDCALAFPMATGARKFRNRVSTGSWFHPPEPCQQSRSTESASPQKFSICQQIQWRRIFTMTFTRVRSACCNILYLCSSG